MKTVTDMDGNTIGYKDSDVILCTILEPGAIFNCDDLECYLVQVNIQGKLMFYAPFDVVEEALQFVESIE